MTDKIHVLMITGSLNVGGMETVAMNIARYSAREQTAIDFLVYGDDVHEYEAEAVSLGCRVIHVPFPRDNPLVFPRNVRNVIKEYGPYDIVHSHLLFNSGLAMKAAYDAGVPVRITHCHTNVLRKDPSRLRRIYEQIMRLWIRKYSTTFYACSENAGRFLFGKAFARCGHIMNNGINPSKFEADPKIAEKYKKELRLEDCKLIGQIGRLHSVKNHYFSLKLMAELCKRRSDVKLMIIGDGELEDTIRSQIKELELEQNVVMLGNRSDVPALLSTMDVFLLPSWHEGVSVALMEAQAAGLPCVVSQTAYAPESHVTNQVTALPLDAAPDTWVEALLHALEQPRYTGSVKMIEESGFSISAIVSVLVADYRKLITEKSNKYQNS